MLRVINKYCHGYTFVPFAYALKNRGFFDKLTIGRSYSFEDLRNLTHANSGYLKAGLEMLVVLDWIKQSGDDYTVGSNMDEHEFIPKDVITLYKVNPRDLITKKSHTDLLARWLNEVMDGWRCSDRFSLLLEGVILLPVLISLRDKSINHALLSDNESAIPAVKFIQEVFIKKGWAKPSESKFEIGAVGKFMISHSLIAGVTVSYRPLLKNLEKILFGEPNLLLCSECGEESHIDRSLNVIASGFQHEKYFKEVEKVFNQIFEGSTLELPDYIADMGCGDGNLLKRIYNSTAGKTQNKDAFNHRSFGVIGLDYNPKALIESEKKLSQISDHHLLQGDIGNPEQMKSDIEQLGIDFKRTMHVRSFLDHNRPFTRLTDVHSYQKWTQISFASFGIDIDGTIIPPEEMMENLSQHLKKWSKVLNKYGLLALEVHYQTQQTKKNHFDTAEGFHFDTLHTFSNQFLCEPEYYIAAMARNSLFAKRHFYCYPKGFPYNRITLGYYEKESYFIDFATLRTKEIIQSELVRGEENRNAKALLNVFGDISFVLCSNEGNLKGVIVCAESKIDSAAESQSTIEIEALLIEEDIDHLWLAGLLCFAVRFFNLQDRTGKIVVSRSKIGISKNLEDEIIQRFWNIEQKLEMRP
ncbi:hypothetical protein [Desulfospira joergensenii]|uniref:AprA-related methyltransferase n=1 Tax=Desulfospira joergensenii TaxID=53329 RepID=UPI0003F614F0|nr:hypothetical protein [Desulfospira joergensenii]